MVPAGRMGDATARAGLGTLLARAGAKVAAQGADLTAPKRQAFAADAARQALLRHGKGRRPAAPSLGDGASYALAKARGLPLLFKGDGFRRAGAVPAA